METNQNKKQEEVELLEQFVINNYVRGYGPHVMFNRLVKNHPCEYMRIVEQYFSGRFDHLNGTLRSGYHTAIKEVNRLYTELLLHLTDARLAETSPDEELVEKLRELLTRQSKEN